MAVRKRTDYIVLHVTATRPNVKAGAKQVDAWHKARGWSGIGYHFVIRRDGTVEKGRPLNQVGAHVAGYNSISIGISHEGGLDEYGNPADTRTDAQKNACISLIHSLLDKYPSATVCGHRDLSPDRDGDGFIEPHEYLKACPCFDAIPWAAENHLPPAPIKGNWTLPHGKKTPSITLAPDLASGPDARNLYLQRLLSRSGYEFGAIDGIIGTKTKAAIKRFQKAAGLTVTGTFNDDTVSRLRKIHEAPIEIAVNEVRDDLLRKSADTLNATHDQYEQLLRDAERMSQTGGWLGIWQRFKDWLYEK